MRDDMPAEAEVDWLGAPKRQKRGNPELLVQRSVIAFVKRCVDGGDVFHVPNETGGSRHNARHHAFARKAAGVRSGVPDLFAFWPGGSCWMECKAAKGRLSEAQEAMLSYMERCGLIVGVVRSVEDAEAILRRAGAPLRANRLSRGVAV